MPSLSSSPTIKAKKTTSCNVGNPSTTSSLRRGLVKPLAEHNRSTRTRSPAPGSPIASGKRTPATKLSMVPTGGVDLSRRFADSMCFTPSLNRNSPSRTGTACKSRVHETPPVKKAITFSTPRKQKSIRKQLDHVDSLDHGWLRSPDMKTPEAQPSKSPELSKRAMAPQPSNSPEGMESTPSPQPTTSPEFLKRGSVPPPSSGGCYGAGPLIGMPSVKDRRKCKPRGILTIEAELLSQHWEEEQVELRDTSFVPAMASMEWMISDPVLSEVHAYSPIAGEDSELVFKMTFCRSLMQP